MSTEKITLSSPWQLYYKQLNALFQHDEKVKLFFDEDSRTIKIFVDDNVKADALIELLPSYKKFGNVDITIEVHIPNRSRSKYTASYGDVYEAAFSGNTAFSYSKTYELADNPITFVVFKKEVVQYYSDNAGDIHGLTSTLYENLARDILETPDGVYYCTDKAQPGTISSIQIDGGPIHTFV